MRVFVRVCSNACARSVSLDIRCAGVAKVFEDSCPAELFTGERPLDIPSDEWAALRAAVTELRININARQVFAEGASFESVADAIAAAARKP